MMSLRRFRTVLVFLFFKSPPPTEPYTLSLNPSRPLWVHPPLPVRPGRRRPGAGPGGAGPAGGDAAAGDDGLLRDPDRPDRKSTRLNSSHANISYAVFCLKKKKIIIRLTTVVYIYFHDA